MKSAGENLRIGKYELINFTELSQEEAEIVRVWRNSERVRRWMFNDHTISKEEHRNFLLSLRGDTTKLYWLVRDSSDYLGVVSLRDINPLHRRAYGGLYSNPDMRGKGKILGKLLMKVAFDILTLHTLRMEVIETNEKAKKLYKDLGFRGEGILRDFLFRDGRWLNVVVMSITEEEYKDADRGF